MNDIRYANKKLMVSAIILTLLMAQGCNNQEDAKEHLQKGIEYLNKGEYDKAKLELETSSQSDKDTAQTYYYLALLDEKNHQYKSMKENLIKSLELAPNNVEARLKLGNVLLLLGEPVKAIDQAELILKENGQDLKGLILKASAYISQKKLSDSEQILDQILLRDPKQLDALSLKSLIFSEKNDLKKALEYINTAIGQDEKNISFQLFKIQLHAKANDFNSVISDYKRLIGIYPENPDYKVMLAKVYTQQGNKKEAEDLFRELVTKYPENVKPKLLLLDFLAADSTDRSLEQFHSFVNEAKGQSKILLELADWMIVRKNFDEANIILNQVIASEKDSNIGYTAKLNLAKNTLESKDYDTADKIVDEILAEKPDNDNAKILKARFYIVKQLPDEAIEILNKIAWARPNSDEVLYLLGQANLIKDNKQEADKNFTKALDINPANYEALVYVYDKALATKDIKYAKDILRKALKINPDNLVLLEKLTKINMSEENWDEAKIAVQQISNVNNPLAKDLSKFLEAQILQGQGECPKAVPMYKTLLEKYPENSDALVSLGRCYEKLGKRSEMIAYLNDALIKNGQNFSAGVLLAELYGVEKNYAKGAALLNQLIQKEPKIPRLYALLANLKLAENDKPGAVTVYKSGLEKMPDSPELSLSLASIYESQGEQDLSIKLYERLVEKNPRLDVATNNLAFLLSEKSNDKQQLDRAEQLAVKFRDSEQLYFRDTYAWILIKQNRLEEGLQILNKIVAAAPEVSTFRYHLAVAQYKNGDPSLAKSQLKQAIELSKTKSNFPDKSAAESLLAEITKNGH